MVNNGLQNVAWIVSMKARPKGHIATRLFKVAKEHHQTTTKNSCNICRAAGVVIIVPLKGENWRFIYFRRIFHCPLFRRIFHCPLFRRIFHCPLFRGIFHCPLSNARSFIVTAPGISLGVNFKSLNHKSFLSSPPIPFFFLNFAGNLMMASRPRFHGYFVSGTAR